MERSGFPETTELVVLIYTQRAYNEERFVRESEFELFRTSKRKKGQPRRGIPLWLPPPNPSRGQPLRRGGQPMALSCKPSSPPYPNAIKLRQT
ncbi:MAG: hypothetical protein ABFS56_29265 [Pseudomonadota bacterium]